MKKILQGVAICFAVLIVVGIGAGYFMLTYDGDRPTSDDIRPTVTDPSGNSYLAVVTPEGSTHAAVTDAAGNVYAAEILPDGNIGPTIGSINDAVKKDELPTNTSDVNSTTNPTNPTNPADPNTTTTVPVFDEMQPYRIEKSLEIFTSGQYLMTFSTNDESLGTDPVTAATKNGNVVIDANISDMKCKMLFLASKDTTYLLLDKYKKYCKLPEELMEDMDMSSMMSGFESTETKYEITVKKVTENGKELFLETYVDDNGSTVNYYFDGEQLVRRENISASGVADITYIEELTGVVDDSLFEIPDNYGSLNLSWLGMFM